MTQPGGTFDVGPDPLTLVVVTPPPPPPPPPVTPTVEVLEAVGATQDTLSVHIVHLLPADVHSGSSPTSAPLLLNGASQVYSFERWVRLRMNPPFTSLQDFRFWVPDYTTERGWMLTWGTSPVYQTPVNTPSSIATSPLPTTDPGGAHPNLNPSAVFQGTGTQYSDWIVVQASVDSSASVGPLLGFNPDNSPVEIEYMFAWTETA